MLSVEGIESGYGDVKVLQGITFKVKKRSITCLLGPNGSGKTTTLKTLAGLLRPWSGSIKFENNEIKGKKSHEIATLGLRLVPEGRKLFGEMSVIENLQMGAYLKDSREKFKDRAEWIFSIFPILKERQAQKASTLSGGEQQMLAIARALISEPKLLLLDEPSFGLAPKLAFEMLETIRKLRDEEGLTILLVEQNIHLASQVMDYGYVIYHGTVLTEGTYKDLLNNPHVRKAYLGT